MGFVLLSGSSNRRLAAAVAAELEVPVGACELERFPDGELHVDVREPVRGRAVYIVQSTAPPVAEHLVELLFMADACWRGAAAHVTAVMPYFGYARQDRRTSAGEALGARLVADVLAAAGVDRCLVVDPHSAALEGCFDIPIVRLSAVSALVERLRPSGTDNLVVAAPDLGAVKLAERYGKSLGRPVALVYKKRLTGSAVVTEGTVGMVQGMSAIIVDDMISTGRTIEAAMSALAEAGCSGQITVVATHAVLAGDAIQRLSRLAIARLIVTDSVSPPNGRTSLPLEVVSLAPLLAAEIKRIEEASG